jgi:hypothetical protein
VADFVNGSILIRNNLWNDVTPYLQGINSINEFSRRSLQINILFSKLYQVSEAFTVTMNQLVSSMMFFTIIS